MTFEFPSHEKPGVILRIMALGPKMRRYLDLKQDPAGTLNTFMRSMEQTATAIAHSVADKIIKDRLVGLPYFKGDPGYTPVKGKDYLDGMPGYTPVPGKDYLSITASKKLVTDAAKLIYERLKKEGITPSEVRSLLKENRTSLEQMIRGQVTSELRAVSALIKKYEVQFAKMLRAGGKIDAAKIARAIEALPLKDRLDYQKGLKNQPSESVKGAERHTLHRGGSSKQTNYYDLSDFCDGNTRTFAIPANTRVLSVSGTDAPGGIYRPLVDWTGSGSMQLTLSAKLAAPSQGATLYILYVV